jgi:hypothetical protein
MKNIVDDCYVIELKLPVPHNQTDEMLLKYVVDIIHSTTEMYCECFKGDINETLPITKDLVAEVSY